MAVSELQASGIPCAAVLDSAVGFILDKVDMVFVGAEGVVENGGIINQVTEWNKSDGSYTPYWIGHLMGSISDRYISNCLGCKSTEQTSLRHC